MTVRFDSKRLAEDFAAYHRRRRISMYRACVRADVQQTTVSKVLQGLISDITVTTMVRMMHLIEEYDISKYIFEEPKPTKITRNETPVITTTSTKINKTTRK